MFEINLRRIRDLREDMDLKQRDLAKALNISQRAYSHYENGTRKIPLDILVALADYYNCSVDYLLGRTKKKDVNKWPVLSTNPLYWHPYLIHIQLAKRFHYRVVFQQVKGLRYFTWDVSFFIFIIKRTISHRVLGRSLHVYILRQKIVMCGNKNLHTFLLQHQQKFHKNRYIFRIDIRSRLIPK